MNKETRHLYKRFRLTGQPGSEAIANARTVARFDELEANGLVRIHAKEYQADEFIATYGPADGETALAIDRDGAYEVETEYYDGLSWQFADCVACVCPKPTDPFHNGNVPELMNTALQLLGS